MHFSLRLYLYLLTFSFLTACALPSDSSGDLPGLDSYTTLAGNQFTSSSRDLLSGTGQILFDELVSSSTRHSFEVKANLQQTGSTLILWDLTSNNLTQGIKLTFTRTSNLALSATLSIDGSANITLSSTSFDLNQPQDLHLVIDVYNDAIDGIRILIWKKGADGYSAVTADIDTDNNSHISGTIPNLTTLGSYWGLDLTNTEITIARQGASH